LPKANQQGGASHIGEGKASQNRNFQV